MCQGDILTLWCVGAEVWENFAKLLHIEDASKVHLQTENTVWGSYEVVYLLEEIGHY